MNQVCPHCQQAVGINASMVGQTVACPHCAGAIQIPAVSHPSRYTVPAWMAGWSSVITAAASVIAMIASVNSCFLVLSIQRSAARYDQRVEVAEQAIRERVQKEIDANERKIHAMEEYNALEAQQNTLKVKDYDAAMKRLKEKYPEIFKE